jgi:hypothetical protein
MFVAMMKDRGNGRLPPRVRGSRPSRQDITGETPGFEYDQFNTLWLTRVMAHQTMQVCCYSPLCHENT